MPQEPVTSTGEGRPDWLAKGEALRKNRIARGEAQRAAAERMGIPQRLLNDIEHGRADPMALLFPEIAND